jgi:hypothetical protein
MLDLHDMLVVHSDDPKLAFRPERDVPRRTFRYTVRRVYVLEDLPHLGDRLAQMYLPRSYPGGRVAGVKEIRIATSRQETTTRAAVQIKNL